MEFQDWTQGVFLKRYKRFFADIALEKIHGEATSVMGDEIVTTHTPNTGSMKGLLHEGSLAIISPAKNPDRKLKFTLELLKPNGHWVGVNTSLTNHLVHEALQSGWIEELKGYRSIKPEMKISKDTRLDFFLSDHSHNHEDCYVEVKNVTLINSENEALFPDSVSTRGQKHLQELIDLKLAGKNAAIIFVIQRMDVTGFQVSNPIDPEYERLLRKAHDVGVVILPYRCHIEVSTEDSLGNSHRKIKGLIKISEKLPIVFH